MNVQQLKSQIDAAPLADRATLDKLYLYMTVADLIKPEYADMLAQAESYQGFLNAVFMDESRKHTLEWAEIAKLKRRNWLSFFEPDILVQNLRMKTDGLPIQMGSGVVLAPTGSRDNIAIIARSSTRSCAISPCLRIRVCSTKYTSTTAAASLSIRKRDLP